MNRKKSPTGNAGDHQGTTDRRADNLDARLLDLAFEPVMVRHFNGEISYWNRGAGELYGYSSEEAIGAVSHDLLKTVFPLLRQDFDKQLVKEGVWIGELIHTARDGRKIIVESRQQLFEQPDGRRLVLETNRDITTRETQYRTLFEGMQEGAGFCRMIYDEQSQPVDWVYLDVNPALEKILGIAGMTGQRNSDLFPGMKESNPELFETFGRVSKTGMPDTLEGYLHGLDMWVYLSVFSPARGHFIAIGKDISDRKRQEEELFRSRNQLKFFVEQVPASVAMLDKDLRYVSFSRRWLDDYGLGNQDLTGRHHYDVFPEIRNKPDWQAVHQRALAGKVERNDEDHFIREDGTDSWIRWEVRPWLDVAGEIGGILIFSEDISQRKKAESELRQVKERLEHLLTAGPAVIYACKPDGDFGATFVSNNIESQLGYAPEEFLIQSDFWAGHIHPDDAQRVFAGLPKLFETGRHSHEYRFLHKNGTYRWMLDELRLVRDADGKPLEIIGAWHDITELKLAEEELRENEQSLRLSLDAARMGMWDWNLGTDALWWDDREYELFGILPGEFSGYAAQAFERIHPDDREKARKAVMDAISAGGLFDTEFRVIHPDGSIHWLAARGQGVAAGVNRMVGVNYDITGLKQAERERDKYTRMENMAQMHRLHIAGEFAALLAHQLNQPLTAIRSFAEAGIARLRKGKLEPEQMRETLNDVVTQSERAAGSIRDLRKFLARQPQEMTPGDINAEVNAACMLMDIMARGRKIKIKLNLAVDLPLVSMRTSQIEQIIVNLMENAMDAINQEKDKPNGGSIEINTHLDADNREIVIDILDSGPGLDEEAVGRVFDPLYTTKKNGIGMGLVISRSIVADHGGRIWAEPGSGGRFFFTLPVPK